MRKELKNTGITLIALVITIIILLILASIAAYSGASVIKSSKFTKFQTELEIMQMKTNEWYETYKNDEDNNKIISELGVTATLPSDSDTSFSGAGLINDGNYLYFSQNAIKNLNIDGVDDEFLINIKNRSVISYGGFKYEGITYYTLDQIPNSLYNVEYENKNTAIPTFQINAETIEEGKHRISIPYDSIKYDGYIKKWNVQYKKDGAENWHTTEDLSFVINEDGGFLIRIINNDISSEPKHVILLSGNEKLLYQADSLTFDGTNYFDTKVQLFNVENYNKDFEIKFTITDIDYSNTENQATLLNAKLENKSQGWPGFALRRKDANATTEITAKGNNATPKLFNNSEILDKEIIITREDGIIYYSVGGEEKVALFTQNKQFDTPLTFGCSLTEDGKPQRYFKGAIADVSIIIKDKAEIKIKEELIKNEVKVENVIYKADSLTFDGTNYVNTGMQLFSEANYNRNFNIKFKITEILPTTVSQTTIINSKLEKESEGYPGFAIRKSGDSKSEFAGRGVAEKRMSYSNANLIDKEIIISRIDDKIYYSIDGVNYEWFTQNKKFDIPVTIGCSLNENRNPWRYFIGTVTNVSIEFVD